MRKLLTIIISIMLVVTMIPSLAFAAETKDINGEKASDCYIDLDDTNNGELTDDQAELMEQFVEELGKQLNYDKTGIDTSIDEKCYSKNDPV